MKSATAKKHPQDSVAPETGAHLETRLVGSRVLGLGRGAAGGHCSNFGHISEDVLGVVKDRVKGRQVVN